MTNENWLEIYLEGWRTGNAALSLSATAPGFYYDDPATGRIQRDGLEQFIEDFKSAGAEVTGGQVPSPFLEYTDLIIGGTDPAIAWCWWCVSGTDFRGAACIRFDKSGVLSERIAYFTDNPSAVAVPEDPA